MLTKITVIKLEISPVDAPERVLRNNVVLRNTPATI